MAFLRLLGDKTKAGGYLPWAQAKLGELRRLLAIKGVPVGQRRYKLKDASVFVSKNFKSELIRINAAAGAFGDKYYVFLIRLGYDLACWQVTEEINEAGMGVSLTFTPDILVPPTWIDDLPGFHPADTPVLNSDEEEADHQFVCPLEGPVPAWSRYAWGEVQPGAFDPCTGYGSVGLPDGGWSGFSWNEHSGAYPKWSAASRHDVVYWYEGEDLKRGKNLYIYKTSSTKAKMAWYNEQGQLVWGPEFSWWYGTSINFYAALRPPDRFVGWSYADYVDEDFGDDENVIVPTIHCQLRTFSHEGLAPYHYPLERHTHEYPDYPVWSEYSYVDYDGGQSGIPYMFGGPVGTGTVITTGGGGTYVRRWINSEIFMTCGCLSVEGTEPNPIPAPQNRYADWGGEEHSWQNDNIKEMCYDNDPSPDKAADDTFIIMFKAAGWTSDGEWQYIGEIEHPLNQVILWGWRKTGTSHSFRICYKIDGQDLQTIEVAKMSYLAIHNYGQTNAASYGECGILINTPLTDWNDLPHNEGSRMKYACCKVTSKYLIYTYIWQEYDEDADDGDPEGDDTGWINPSRILGVISRATGEVYEMEVNEDSLGEIWADFDETKWSAMGLHKVKVA